MGKNLTMPKFDPMARFITIRKNATTSYDEDIHCPLILEVMNNEGTMAAFCARVSISDGMFHHWTKKYPLFNDCYQIGKMYSKANWEQAGRDGQADEGFDYNYWRLIGASRYGVSATPRIKLDVDADSNPYEQYKQLINQASREEFTASEIKQLMESLNVGRAVYETFKLQESVDEIQLNLERMKTNHEHNSSAIEEVKKTD